MAARKLWKGEKAIPKNREPLKKKEWPSRRTPKKVEPLTIMKIKPPIEGRRTGKPVPPPPPKPIKPAPARSPTLKWHKKSR